jgi:hypothetical protein
VRRNKAILTVGNLKHESVFIANQNRFEISGVRRPRLGSINAVAEGPKALDYIGKRLEGR